VTWTPKTNPGENPGPYSAILGRRIDHERTLMRRKATLSAGRKTSEPGTPPQGHCGPAGDTGPQEQLQRFRQRALTTPGYNVFRFMCSATNGAQTSSIKLSQLGRSAWLQGVDIDPTRSRRKAPNQGRVPREKCQSPSKSSSFTVTRSRLWKQSPQSLPCNN